MPKKTLKMDDLFYRGQYAEILKNSVDSKSWLKTESELPYVIGALSFTGRMEEARLLAEVVFHREVISNIIKTRFFLGLGLTRLSEYSQANKLFAANLNEVRRQSLEPSDLFFVYQGISFYRYYCGQFSAAKKASDVAFIAAFKMNDLYGKVLSTDIRSHILIQLGDTATGFELMNRAQALAENLQNGSIVMAIQISRMNYRARLGMDPKNSLRDLFHAVSTLAPEDNYSRAGYLLELSRQLTLRGRITEAASILDRASESIYAQQNRRQEATLNLRYSYVMYCAGEYSRSLSYIRSAKRTLHPEVDRVLENEALGLELKVVKALKMDSRAEEIHRALKNNSRHESHFINQRILSRGAAAPAPATELRHGADPLGDLLDLLRTDAEAGIEDLLKDEYLGLLYDVLQVDRQRPVLYIDLRPGLLLSLDRGQVMASQGVTALHRKIFRALEKGAASKELLFTKAWGMKYDPLRHDTVIYAGITSIRKLLGEKASWLETIEDGYRWRSGFEIIFHAAEDAESETAVTMPSQIREEPASVASLNHRQIQALRRLRKQEFVDVQEYKFLFGISDITASRDLSSLLQTGHVVRIGRARATRYKLKSSKTMS
jgi:hypothetical protein